MAVEIEKEPKCFENAEAELCIFCYTPTRFWNVVQNKPICLPCAKVFNQKDVDEHEYDFGE